MIFTSFYINGSATILMPFTEINALNSSDGAFLTEGLHQKQHAPFEELVLHQQFASLHGEAIADASISKLKRFFTLHPSNFAAFLDEIEHRYGTFDSYLINGLNITSSDRDRLIKELTYGSRSPLTRIVFSSLSLILFIDIIPN